MQIQKIPRSWVPKQEDSNICWCYSSPSQCIPFPEYPFLQAHENDPSVSIHFASVWQLWVSDEHSSKSIKEHANTKETFVKYLYETYIVLLAIRQNAFTLYIISELGVFGSVGIPLFEVNLIKQFYESSFLIISLSRHTRNVINSPSHVTPSPM